MPAAVILVEAMPRRSADGVAETVRIAGGGGQFPYFYGGQHWRAGVVQLPTFITSINFEGGDFGEGGVPQAAELQWAPTTKVDLTALANYFWIDAAITVRIGAENATGTLPPIALTGKVLAAPVEGGTIKIQLSDPAADLKKPLLTDRYGGTGGLDGPADWEGKIKDRVWGRVWNKLGEPIDKANNIYAYADPTRPLQAFDAVRDKGVAAASLSLLAWQGSTAATLTALRAATPVSGGGVVCPSIACVKWWAQPAGDLTADLRGEIGAGYIEKTADIVQRIVAAGPNTPFAAGTIAAALAARPAPVGWVARDDSTTIAAMIQELLGNSSMLWLLNAAGDIELREWAWGAPAITATSYSVKRTAMFRPVATRTIGYRRNERRMARGDIAGIIFAGDVLLSDGRTGDALATQLNDVEALADASAALIESAADDGVLDRKEKSSILVPRNNTLEAIWSYLDGQAAVLSAFAQVASARATASAARTAWQVYRDALSPAWNNDTLDTAVVRATFVGKLNDFDYAIDLLADALRQASAVNNVNLIRDPLFQKVSTEWSAGVAGGVTSSGFPSVGLAAGYRYYKVVGESFFGPSRFIFIAIADSTRIKCEPGERYAFQCKVEGQSLGGTLANQYLRVQWYNSSNALITETNLQTLSGPQTIGTLMSGFGTAPAGAASMKFVFYGDTGTTGQISVLVSEPMISTATPDQTIMPAFARGPSSGDDALSVTASSNSISVPSTANGTPKAALQGFSFTAYKGETNVTNTATGTSYSITASANLSGVTHTGNGVFTVSGMSADMGYVDVTITNGSSQVVRVTYTKARDGAAFVTAGGDVTAPSSTTHIVASTILLLAGPNGTFGINYNGSFTVSGSSGNLTGYVEISPNGSSWTFVGNISSFGSIPGEPGSYVFGASIAGGSYGITAKTTVHVRLLLAKVSGFTLDTFDGNGSVEWAA